MIIKSALERARNVLGNTEEANRDAEVLLSFVLKKNRAYLYAWPDKTLSDVEWDTFQSLIGRRLQKEPFAYITGEKEFWSLSFTVTKDTLIPRPETELLVAWTLRTFNAADNILIADLGTGCGAIALSIAHERPAWHIIATDESYKALCIAEKNAKKLNIKNVSFYQGDWLNALPEGYFDAIISNPPYIDMYDEATEEGILMHEPSSALFSTDNGLKDISKIITASKNHLKLGGYIAIEHGYNQAMEVQNRLKMAGYGDISLLKDYSNLDRVTVARTKSGRRLNDGYERHI